MPRFTVFYMIVLLSLAKFQDIQAVEIMGHRGASYDAPENTMASFRLAWEQHADACELDVHLSKDQKVVVIHDKTTKRLAGVDKPVVDQTFDELRQLDVGRWKNERFTNERIPLLIRSTGVGAPRKTSLHRSEIRTGKPSPS